MDFRRVAERILTAPYIEQYHKCPNPKLLKVKRKLPVRLDGDQEPSASLAHRRIVIQEALEVSDRLIHKRRVVLKLLDEITQQKRELLENEKAFQDVFVEFNILINQNRHKRDRALVSISENTKLLKRREHEVNTISKKVLKMRGYADLFSREIKKHLIYERFLRNTLPGFDMQGTIFDIVRRFLSLDSKRRYLRRKNATLQVHLEALQERILSLVKEDYVKVIELRNSLSQHLVKFSQSSRKTTETEFLLLDIWNSYMEKLEDFTLSAQAIENLSDMMQQRQGYNIKIQSYLDSIESVKQTSLTEKIEQIRNTMGVVVNLTKKISARLKIMRKMWRKGDD